MKKITVHPKYSFLQAVVESLPLNFEHSGELIYKGRNEVRVIEIDNIKYAIKSYDKMTLANRIIYRTIRKSKAQRAYENAVNLLELNINTPAPVAYMDCYKDMRLVKSYFVSLYLDFQPLSKLVDKPLDQSLDSLRGFASFSHSIHQKGVFHKDFHLNNVLVDTTHGNQVYYLIDNNRMRFEEVNKWRIAKNLKRIHLPFEKQAVFARQYAKESNADPYSVYGSIRFFKILNEMKKTLKGFFKARFKLNRV